MNHDDLESVKAIFDAARKLPLARQEAYVREVCGAGPDAHALAERVLVLLSDLDATDAGFDAATGGAGVLAAGLIRDTGRHGEGVGSLIGPYKLLEEIGEGGFGLVYMAQQEEPIRRRVALKIIKLGLETNQVIARFEQERQALAMMDHPHIAKVLDAGTTPTGRPYFVMELVRGEPITTFCDNKKLTIPQRLELFAKVCHAVQHAHQKGIIHRDLKPSNVLVTVGDGDTPVPKVIDFGIAKATQARLTEKTLFTEFRQMIGTPAYMSPEQAGMGAAGGLDIDTRSDVYALGALLYELLTGVTPFDAQRLRSAAFGELQRMIREDDPPRPSTRVSTEATIADVAARRQVDPKRLGLLVRGELDWVVMRCLEKDRTRRYATADDLARDLNRYLKQEPLEAGPPTAAYRVRKFVRRHRRPVTVAAVLAIALVLGLVGTSIATAWALNERDRSTVSEQKAVSERLRAEAATLAETEARARAEQSATEATRLAYGLGISSAIAAIESGNIELASSSLQNCPEEFRGWEWEHLLWAVDPSMSTFDTPLTTDAFTGSADGRLFTRSPSGEVLVFDIANGRILNRITTPAGRSIAFSAIEVDPSSRYMIVRQQTTDAVKLLSVIELSSGQTLWKLEGTGIGTFADSGGRVVVTAPGGIAVLELTTGEQLDFIPVHGQPPLGVMSGGGTLSPIFIRVSGYEHIVYSLAERRYVATYNTENNALSNDNFHFYLSMHGSEIHRMDMTTGESSVLPKTPSVPIRSMRNLGHGILALLTADRRMRAVSSVDGQTISVTHFSRSIRAWQPVPDGRTILTIDLSGVVKSRSVAVGEQPFVVATPNRNAYAASVSTSSDRTAVTGWGEARVYDTATGEHMWSSYYTTDKLFSSAFSQDGRLLAVGGAERRVALIDTSDGRVVSFLPFNRPGMVSALAWSPSGDRLLAGLTEGDVIEWDARQPTEPPFIWVNSHDTAVSDLAFSDNGRWVVSASTSDLVLPDSHEPIPQGKNEVVLWDASARTRLRVIAEHDSGYHQIAFAPGDKSLAVGANHTLVLHDLETARADVVGTFGQIQAIAFSPDGSRLATITGGNELRILHPHDLSTLATFPVSTGGRIALGFTPDGTTLVLAARSVPVTAWEQTPPADPERRWLASRANTLLDSLFNEEHEVVDWVVRRLEEDESLDEPLRRAAIAAAQARGNNPNRITNIAALALRVSTHSAEQFAKLAELATIGAEGAPESPWAWSTLALAEYRVGRFEEAVSAARRAIQLLETKLPGGHASDWAVIAMASHYLGLADEAADAMNRAETQAGLAGSTYSRHTLARIAEAKLVLSGD